MNAQIGSQRGIIGVDRYGASAEKYKVEQKSSIIFDFNTFNVKAGNGLDINKIKVVDRLSGNTIFQDNRSLKGIENDHGYRVFLIYYENELVYETGHFIKNNWYTNDYLLKINSINPSEIPELKISGTNASYYDYFVKAK